MNAPAHKSQSRLNDFLANPRRALWKLSLPILGGMLIHTLYSLVDMIFVGWVGPDAVTALAFNMPLVFMAYGLTMGLSSGVTAVVAQAIGSGDKARADNTAEHTVVLGVVLGVVLSAGGLLWGRPLLTILGATGDINLLAWTYFKVICWGIIFSVLSSFFRGILAGEGDTVRPMTILGVGMILNIIFDPIFIFVLDMGVVGAAVATVASQAIVFVIFVYMIFRQRNTYVQFRLRYFRFQPAILGAIFAIGLPASISFIFMSFGQAAYNKILSSYSQYAVAAFQIAGRVEMIYFMPIIALAAGVVTLVGMFYGAGEYRQLRGLIRYVIVRAMLFGVIAALIIYPSAPYIMKVFRPSDDILRYGVQYLRVMAFIFPIAPVGMISGRVLQGMGKGLPMMVLTFLRVMAVGAPLAAVFTYVLHLPVIAVWFAMISGGAISMVAGLAWLITTLRHVEQLPQRPPIAAEPPETALEGVG